MFKYYISYYNNLGTDGKNKQKLFDMDIGNVISCFRYCKPIKEYFLDNGAWSYFTNEMAFSEKRFQRGLKHCLEHERMPDFIVLPDKIGDREATLKMANEHLDLSEQFVCYYPLQDGMTTDDISNKVLDNVSGLFLGGNTEEKYKSIGMWSRFVKENDLKLHVGKVGTLQNMIIFNNYGIDSCDSSNFIRNDSLDKLKECFDIVKYIENDKEKFKD